LKSFSFNIDVRSMIFHHLTFFFNEFNRKPDITISKSNVFIPRFTSVWTTG